MSPITKRRMSTGAEEADAPVDERVARIAWWRKLAIRPEFGSIVGAVVVFGFFTWQADAFLTDQGVANYLDVASLLGIMAVAIALLMIGGEFDLSAGVLTASNGLLIGILVTEWGWNIWMAILGALVFSLCVGLFNGFLVIKTNIHSFLITLGTFLMLQGLNLGVTKQVSGTVQIRGIGDASGYDSAKSVFASTVAVGGADYRIAIVWWIGVTAIATWVLLRTQVGNWIFGVGGNALAARSTGVPAAHTKIGLFMTTAFAAWLVGTITALRLTSVQANAGIGEEFEYIIAAVIGGCLLSGGYGSAIGASIGALIFGMTKQGIILAGWDSDWFQLFLGVMLLLAVLTNDFVLRQAQKARS